MGGSRGRPLQPLEMSQETRIELESLARSRTLSHGQVSRAQMLLLCADGVSNDVVADMLGTTRATVGKWRERFRRHGPVRRTAAWSAAPDQRREDHRAAAEDAADEA